MALPATGGGGGAMPMPWHDGAAAAGGHPPPPQQQRRSLLSLPPSTTTPAASGPASSSSSLSPDILAGFLDLPSIRAAGTPTPGHRLLWARIARPVPGVIPSAAAGHGANQDHDQGTNQEQDQVQDQDRGRCRPGGRLWPCLFYYGGCAEVQKEIAAASGKLVMLRKLCSVPTLALGPLCVAFACSCQLFWVFLYIWYLALPFQASEHIFNSDRALLTGLMCKVDAMRIAMQFNISYQYLLTLWMFRLLISSCISVSSVT